MNLKDADYHQYVLKTHETLEEAIAARHVIRMFNRHISNQYWEWCSAHARPYVAITINTLRSRYALVELDVYCLCAGGFDKEAGYEILHAVLDQSLKPKSSFFISPVYVSAHISAMSAKLLAGDLYRIAVRELGLDQVTHEEWIKGEIERTDIGGYRKSAFAPISGEVYPDVVKALLRVGDAIFK
ncbi:MAG: hypothetical protein WB392_13370 [Methanotrichaceae archaeon]